MAETYTKADLDFVYKTAIQRGGKASDVQRILKGLPSTFTLADLQTSANLKGLSSKSKSYWGEAISYLNSAESAAAASPPAVQQAVPAPSAAPKVEDYVPGPGPNSSSLMNTFLGGAMPTSLAPFTAQATPAEQYIQSQLFNSRPAPPSALEQMLMQYVSRGPVAPKASSFENMLEQSAQNPFLNSIARGEIPPSMQEALNRNLALSRANTMEATNMGGALTSSDLAEGLSRSDADARINFLAKMQENAQSAQNTMTNTMGTGGNLYNTREGLGNQLFMQLMSSGLDADAQRKQLDLNKMLGLSSGLLNTQATNQDNALSRYYNTGQFLAGNEEQQRAAGMQRMYEEYLRSTGVPAEIAALISLASLGGGTTVSKTKSSGSGGGGGFLGDLLGSASQGIGSNLAMGGMMGGGAAGAGAAGAGTAGAAGAGAGGSLFGAGMAGLGGAGAAGAGGAAAGGAGAWAGLASLFAAF